MSMMYLCSIYITNNALPNTFSLKDFELNEIQL